jgi:Tfp pilus assembly protein PilX
MAMLDGMNSMAGQHRGMALILALIFLLVLTMLGVAAMQSTVLQERMAGNYAERNQAFQMAELAVRTVERMHRQAVEAGGVVPASHSQGDWPAVCPDIFDFEGRYALGCSGASVATDAQCMNALAWQDIAVQSGSAQFVVVPLDHVFCANPEDESMDSTDDFGAYGLGDRGGASMILVLGRGRGPADTAEAMVQTLYFGGALAGQDYE